MSSCHNTPRKGKEKVETSLREQLRRSSVELCQAAEVGLNLVAHAKELQNNLEKLKAEHEETTKALKQQVEQLELEKASIVQKTSALQAQNRSLHADRMAVLEAYDQDKREAEERMEAAEQACGILKERLRDARLEVLRTQQGAYRSQKHSPRGSEDINVRALLVELNYSEEEVRDMITCREEHAFQCIRLMASGSAAGAYGSSVVSLLGTELGDSPNALLTSDDMLFVEEDESTQPSEVDVNSRRGSKVSIAGKSMKLEELEFTLISQVEHMEHCLRIEMQYAQASAFDLIEKYCNSEKRVVELSSVASQVLSWYRMGPSGAPGWTSPLPTTPSFNPNNLSTTNSSMYHSQTARGMGVAGGLVSGAFGLGGRVGSGLAAGFRGMFGRPSGGGQVGMASSSIKRADSPPRSSATAKSATLSSGNSSKDASHDQAGAKKKSKIASLAMKPLASRAQQAAPRMPFPDPSANEPLDSAPSWMSSAYPPGIASSPSFMLAAPPRACPFFPMPPSASGNATSFAMPASPPASPYPVSPTTNPKSQQGFSQFSSAHPYPTFPMMVYATPPPQANINRGGGGAGVGGMGSPVLYALHPVPAPVPSLAHDDSVDGIFSHPSSMGMPIAFLPPPGNAAAGGGGYPNFPFYMVPAYPSAAGVHPAAAVCLSPPLAAFTAIPDHNSGGGNFAEIPSVDSKVSERATQNASPSSNITKSDSGEVSPHPSLPPLRQTTATPP